MSDGNHIYDGPSFGEELLDGYSGEEFETTGAISSTKTDEPTDQTGKTEKCKN
jgi:hypothetical protein